MEKFKEIMVSAWDVGKYFFTHNIQNTNDYTEYLKKSNDAIRKYPEGSKERKFARALVTAIADYCDDVLMERRIK